MGSSYSGLDNDARRIPNHIISRARVGWWTQGSGCTDAWSEIDLSAESARDYGAHGHVASIRRNG